MKISIAFSLLILVLGSVLGWQENQLHASVRASHEKLVAQAAQLGITLDPTSAVEGVRVTKRGQQREDKEAVAKTLAAEYIAFAKERQAIEKKGGQPAMATQEQAQKFKDRILAMDPTQMKILIAEICASPELEKESRERLIRFPIMILTSDHPQTALALLAESPDFMTENVMNSDAVFESLKKWAKDDPAAALEWVRANGAKFPDLVDDDTKRGMISGTAMKDPQLAFKLIAELGIKDGDRIIYSIAGAAKTSEQRTATLAALRAHLATLPEGKIRDQASGVAIQELGWNTGKEGFEAGSKWIENAALSPEDLADFCESAYCIKSEESGKWIEWIGTKLPVEKSKGSISMMVLNWMEKDYQAVGKWLAATPAGPSKNISIRRYAETAAFYEPESAVQWAMTLPPGQDRDETLKKIDQNRSKIGNAAKEGTLEVTRDD